MNHMKARRAESELVDQTRILVVEDEQDLQDLLTYNLKREGFKVTGVQSGERALEMVRQSPPDLILLDLMLPGVDGLSVCRTIRQERASAEIPVVMLTAKGEETDVVVGLELGADDYVTKPFSPRVLLARIHAVLRRHADSQVHGEGPSPPVIERDALRIDTQRHQVSIKGTPIDLTISEFKLLLQLASHPGRVFTRQQIINAVHGQNAAVTDRSVDTLVVGLRRKLEDLGDMLVTVRGMGYKYMDS